MHKLPLSEKLRLGESLTKTLSTEQLAHPSSSASPHSQSILDIPAVSVGTLKEFDSSRDNLLTEMLEDRFFHKV